MIIKIKHLTAILLVTFLFSCVSYKPIFYKNKKFLDVGSVGANQDFENCKKEAEDFLKEYKSSAAWKEARRKALIGSIVGAALMGSSTETFVGGAVVGSLVGGVAGGLSRAGDDRVKPDQIKNNYISRCLNQKGYDIIGWY
jgi:outer membrane lipoprotein SlyB